jgi:hypothetical protein
MDAAGINGNVTEMLSKIGPAAGMATRAANAVSELEAFFRTYLQLVQSHLAFRPPVGGSRARPVADPPDTGLLGGSGGMYGVLGF